MGDFVEIKLKINGREETVKIEKGVTFENNGARYVVDSNGKLQKQDKKGNNNIWSDASEINMTEYQYSVFCAISDNDRKDGLSKKDIETAFTQYTKGEFKNDIYEKLSSGYNIESTELKKSSKCVSLDVRNRNGNGNSGAKLIFGITENTTTKNTQNTNKPNSHTVKKGETLYSISKQYGMTVDELKKINNLTDNTIEIGQVLKLKKVNENTKASNYKETIPQRKVTKYTIKKGDNIDTIARNNNIPTHFLISYNNILASNSLRIEQIIDIPTMNYDEEALSNFLPQKPDFKNIKSIKDIAKEIKVSEDLINKIIEFEGWNNTSTTIGYGHTDNSGTPEDVIKSIIGSCDIKSFYNSGKELTKNQALQLLAADIYYKKTFIIDKLKETKGYEPDKLVNHFVNLPQSVQEGVLDKVFRGNENIYTDTFIKNILENNNVGIVKILKQSKYTESGDRKRDIYRTILASKGLSPDEKQKIIEDMKAFYNTTSQKLSGKDKINLDNAWNEFCTT